jgi:transposase
LELVAQHPDLTLQEIRSALATGQGISVGLTSLWRFLKAQKITLKKRA